MKTLVSGRRKNGTTATLFKIAAGLPHCKVLFGAHRVHLGDHENIVQKHTTASEKAGPEAYISYWTRSWHSNSISCA